jgi:DNA repair exonuclease SbcCD nuclease subunit
MKLLVVGDLHLVHTHLDRSIKLLRWVETVAEEYSVDAVVGLGDTMNNHAVLRSEIMSEFGSHAVRMVKDGRPYIVLLGNHDYFKPNDPSYHALQSFKELNSDLYIVDKPSKILDMSFVPFLTINQEWPKDTQRIIFCHQTFAGSVYSNNTLVENGIESEGIDCDLIVGGHIHTRQMVGTKILYPGTPLATSANDIDQDKGVMILDTETLKYYYISSPFPMWRSHEINISAGDALEFDGYSESDHHIIKLIGTSAEIKASLLSKELNVAKKQLSTQIKVEVLDSRKVDKKSISYSSPKDVVEQYIDKVYKGSVDKEELKNMAIRYIIGDRQ